MQGIVDQVIDRFGIPVAWSQLLYFVGAGLAIILPFIYVLVFAGVYILLERRIGGRMQSRIGPNRVGPQGVIQWVADALKVLTKEDLVPRSADGPLFRIGPLLAVVGVMLGVAVVPFGGPWIGADLDVGLLYLLSVTSLVVCGILMSGWASNSKWALFGGLRSTAQIVSYEIPHATSLLAVVLLTGTMSVQGIIGSQGWLPWDWLAMHSPFALAAFVIYFISSLAEGSRVPFDLPEAESELVAGYNTEYSGWRFLLFFLTELANVWVMSAIAVVGFLGGGNVPTLGLVDGMPWYATATPAVIASLPLASVGFWVLVVFSFASIMFKCWVVAVVISQVRWTMPRFRVDQMMLLCWKYLVPLSFAAILVLMVLMRFLPLADSARLAASFDGRGLVALLVRLATTALCALAVAWYVGRVAFTIRNARDELFVKFAL
ncbi:MAG: NADH-quinone oxidoreductase subunit H [Deltaproteobacteria bacterium]|nr:NADH-quinone oxidoreductase subunit H [Deltaproteobacteria bacterium]